MIKTKIDLHFTFGGKIPKGMLIKNYPDFSGIDGGQVILNQKAYYNQQAIDDKLPVVPLNLIKEFVESNHIKRNGAIVIEVAKEEDIDTAVKVEAKTLETFKTILGDTAVEIV